MKHVLNQPVAVGDFAKSVQIDELEMESVSLTFDAQRPVLSFVMLHRASGWQWNVVYSDSSAVEFWARTLESQFDEIIRKGFLKMADDNKIPPGTLSAGTLSPSPA